MPDYICASLIIFQACGAMGKKVAEERGMEKRQCNHLLRGSGEGEKLPSLYSDLLNLFPTALECFR